jgi:hypothetical protein
MTTKTPEELQIMVEGGAKLSAIKEELKKAIRLESVLTKSKNWPIN